MFTQLAYQESFTVYNVITRNRRNSVERVFRKVTAQWAAGAFDLGRILENEFAVQGTAAPVVEPANPTGAINKFIEDNGNPE